jgi:hypothetical protein
MGNIGIEREDTQTFSSSLPSSSIVSVASSSAPRITSIDEAKKHLAKGVPEIRCDGFVLKGDQTGSFVVYSEDITTAEKVPLNTLVNSLTVGENLSPTLASLQAQLPKTACIEQFEAGAAPP